MKSLNSFLISSPIKWFDLKVTNLALHMLVTRNSWWSASSIFWVTHKSQEVYGRDRDLGTMCVFFQILRYFIPLGFPVFGGSVFARWSGFAKSRVPVLRQPILNIFNWFLDHTHTRRITAAPFLLRLRRAQSASDQRKPKRKGIGLVVSTAISPLPHIIVVDIVRNTTYHIDLAFNCQLSPLYDAVNCRCSCVIPS